MRLINADAMLERNKNSIYDTTDLEEMLKYEPTAYDVDKVVNRLEDYLFEKYCIEGDGEIERIVKGGSLLNE